MDREQHSIQLEKQHVHDVYDRIAPHFSDTRYKAWPQVKQFLMKQEPGSLIADVGCGNGKYLDINPFTWKLGSDHCNSLASIAGGRGHEVMVCDNLRLPYRDNCFDAAISIAVVHHFATVERRVAAIRELARVVRPGGQVMIYVWALEQTHRKFEAQDVLVPWHMQAHYLQSTAHNTPKKQKKVKDKSKRNNHQVQDHQDSSRMSILSQRPSSNQHSHSLHKNHSQSALQQSSKCQEPSKRRGSFSILGLNLPFAERNGYHWNSETSLFRSLWNNSMEQLSQGEDSYEERTATSVEGFDHQNVTNNKTNGITEAYLKADRRTRSLDIENTEDSDGVEVSIPNGETRELQNKYGSADRARKPLEQIRQEQEHVRGRSHSLGGEDISEKYYRNHHKPEAAPAEPEDLSQYHRYYHVFREGELAGLIEEHVENLHILQDFYDHANWCVIAEKVQVWTI
ncbi:hypothetical protein Bbelb_269520 [Branchiostoma belcheri]|nr:hypothetical protein Bbelb_269520 [Branchiostoma belcheri]